MGKLLIVSTDAGVIQAMTEQFPAGDEFQIVTAANFFDAGCLVDVSRPDVLLIDLGMGRAEACLMALNFRRGTDHRDVVLIALANPDDAGLQALGTAGFAYVVYRPFDPAAVAGLVWARLGRRST